MSALPGSFHVNTGVCQSFCVVVDIKLTYNRKTGKNCQHYCSCFPNIQTHTKQTKEETFAGGSQIY